MLREYGFYASPVFRNPARSAAAMSRKAHVMRISSLVYSLDSGVASSGGGGGVGTPMIRPAAPSITTPRPVAAPSPSIPTAIKEVPAEPPPPKIHAFEQKLGVRKHEDSWNRTPNSMGTGAIHVKSFHCKLNDDSLVYMDQQINEWLDAHPQYEVKLVTTAVGEWVGKMKEMQMVVQVWV